MPTAQTGDIKLEYYTEGSGPPLLLVMGWAGSAHSWGQPFLDELTKHFMVTWLSNRGTGESDKPQEQTTIRMMADDAVALLDALGIGRTHVVGISMGGMIAQEIAINYPERVNGLVLGCTSVGAPKAIAADQATMQAMTFEPNMTPVEMIRRSWYALVSDDFVASHNDFLEEMLQSFLRWPTPLDTIMKQVVAIAGFSTVGRGKDITAPTLVLHGDIDRLMPPANGDNVHTEIPGSQLHRVEGVGHMFFWEKPEESAQVIRQFLSKEQGTISK
jgi:pimeloyl-ACP methyl ester carboxylesterase